MKGLGYIKDETMKSLIKIGAKGFFPLFEDVCPRNFMGIKSTRMTKKEKSEAKKLLGRLEKHKCLDRKKTIIHSLLDEEKEILIKAFLNLVEGQIINERPGIQ
ncbi:MAG: hypothetical protein ACO20H_11965 [Bacteriovoracaceae bacterium]